MYELPVFPAAPVFAAVAPSVTCRGRVSARDLVTCSLFFIAPMVRPGARAAGPAAPAW